MNEIVVYINTGQLVAAHTADICAKICIHYSVNLVLFNPLGPITTFVIKIFHKANLHVYVT